jgi:hypothetical protein
MTAMPAAIAAATSFLNRWPIKSARPTSSK